MIISLNYRIMRNKNKKQISNSGLPLISGLEVLSGIITYDGEYVNFGNALAYKTQLSSDTDHATTAADPHVDALVNSPASTVGRWYRYHTTASADYTAGAAPDSADGYFSFTGKMSGGDPSYSGMYQKLSLIKGNQYQIEIQNVIDGDTGTLHITVYKPIGSSYVVYHSDSTSFPVTNTSTGLKTSTFTAESPDSILVLYFTTTAGSTTVVSISNISIKEKKEYLIPIHGVDTRGDSHKILKRNQLNRGYPLVE
tara:strand:+ start:8421 stop:9182 length:762 start_codon:yes stop_codon:yes gene_type:complete